MKSAVNTSLNGICPYFTMFPLEFPYGILKHEAKADDWVIDPFCGRGTTNYASRMLGLPSIGIDSSPVAMATSCAKLANTTPERILQAAKTILDAIALPAEVPQGEFWEWAFHKEVLVLLCRLREGLLTNCESDARKALRGIILGALHGPRGKYKQSYFSNQSQRTYAPKPHYAVNYWKKYNLRPERVDVLAIIEDRAQRYYEADLPAAKGHIVYGDSRSSAMYHTVPKQISWIITSPPYYGMRTYLPDQWLRLWFCGGPAHVTYSNSFQVEHSGPDIFAQQLRQVWKNLGSHCLVDAKLIIRFGGINDRKVDPSTILLASLEETGWHLLSRSSAGFASRGRRQALHFSKSQRDGVEEHDFWACWRGI